MQVNKQIVVAVAATPIPLGDTGGISYDSVVKSLNYVVSNVLLLAGLVAVAAIVWYGLKMSLSRGDPAKFTESRGMLVKALIGAVIIFGVYTIIATVYGASKSIGQ